MSKTQTASPTTARFQRASPRWSAIWALHHLKHPTHRRETGGNCTTRGSDTPATRRQKAPCSAKPPPQPPEVRRVAHKTWAQCRLARKNAEFGVCWEHRANCFAHEARQHGDIETNNTTAHPQQGTAETGTTSAPEKCTKYTHFAPAKATTVSTPYRYQQAKATPVSGERAAWSTGPRCDTRGRRRGLAGRPVGGRRYKRRQSEPKNHHFQRKSRWIDDVCNNGAESRTKNTLD